MKHDFDLVVLNILANNVGAYPLPSPAMNILKIATLNINGIHTTTRIAMLHDFLKCHAIDILFLQEVTHPKLDNLPGYITYTNVGTTMTWTAFVMRNGLQITNINIIPSGREIAAESEGTILLNVYAPSGTKNRQREKPSSTLILYTSDATDTCTYSRTLAALYKATRCAMSGHNLPPTVHIPITR